MNATLSENIIEYANKKGRAGLEIGIKVTGCCCGSFFTTYTHFISSGRIEALRKRGFNELDADGLKVMIDGAIPITGDVKVEMVKPLGVKTFQFEGLDVMSVTSRSCRSEA